MEVTNFAGYLSQDAKTDDLLEKTIFMHGAYSIELGAPTGKRTAKASYTFEMKGIAGVIRTKISLDLLPLFTHRAWFGSNACYRP